jgi:UDP-N-acetyl-2-amino-2-deoxyglucuronate dehydrogenase
MEKKIKFAIVGFGHIGKRHAAIITGNPNTEVVAVCDSSSELKSFADKEYSVPFFTSVDDLLKSDIEIDVACICTPNGLHAEQAIKSLQRKCHVVCEKPMGLHKSDCEKVIYTALQNSKQVFCVMQNRYSPPSVWLKELVDNKTLGDIFQVQINCYWNRDDRYYSKSEWKGKKDLDGGPLFTQFSHFIDIMYWLFGDITDVNARFENFNHQHNTEFEDSGFVSFSFVNGGIGSINYSTSVWDANLESSITIIGSKGTVKVGGQYMDKVEYCHVQDYVMPELAPVNPPNDYGTYKGSAANHHYVIENVVDTLSGKSTVSTNALEGLKVVEIIERIYKNR